MTNLNALKKLTATIVGGITPEDIPGDTISEVIDYLAKFKAGEILGTLTVKSSAGSEIGNTAITVTPTLTSGNSYAYKTAPSAIAAPEYLDDASSYSTWNGTSEIAAEDGHYIAIYEINANKQILKFGQTKVAINLG